MAPTPEDQRILEEYNTLLDRSQQLFSGLRDVPQFGQQWQPYFQRTFEVYTKLWKFQQIHRAVLEAGKGERFSFKRHDIGEIASKIGQLYYHYYLRTSEPNYLTESCVFYDAIRTRRYFNDVLDPKNPAPMVKKLRYYARFIVVCLLLNNRKMVTTLVTELTGEVELYLKTFNPSDTQEWQFVLQEISQFLNADNILALESEEDLPSRRLSQKIPVDMTSRIKLQEVLLVGNCSNQVKFSELTLDMFRMMQSVEWDSDAPSDQVPVGKGKRNPHKYLLYRPTMSQVLVFLANSFKELHDNNVLLLYISADGITEPVVANPEEPNLATPQKLCTRGGVALNSRRPLEKEQHSGVTAGCFYPEDLMTYTRKHLFLIIDSDNSGAFNNIPSLFGKQVVCLMSPKEQPLADDSSEIGNLFTLFLTDPISAFCYVMSKTTVSNEIHTQLQGKLDELFTSLLNLIQSPGVDPAFGLLSQEDFLQRFILNYVFCAGCLYYHKQFQHEEHIYFPKIHPELPDELFHHRVLQSAVYDMAKILEASSNLLGEL